LDYRISGNFSTNEPKPVLKTDKGGQYAPDFYLTRPATQKGVSMLRIFLPLFSILGGQYLPDCHEKQT